MNDEALDLALIDLTTGGLPLVSRPYEALAASLGVQAERVEQRFMAMQDSGRIRRIAAVPNHYKIGYVANGMSVWDVDDKVIAAMGEAIGQLAFVSHCYQRPRRMPQWPYNLFAMIHGRSHNEVLAMRLEIESLLGAHCCASDILFSRRILKKTGFRLK